MKLRLISEELYITNNKTTIDIVEAENGVPLITAHVAEMDEDNGVLQPFDNIRCIVSDELYDYDVSYAIDAFKLLFTDPSFKGKIIEFNGGDDNSIVDTLVANRLLVRVDGGFVLGGGNNRANYPYMDGNYRATNTKSAKKNSKQDLANAVAYHAANYGGKRWLELERLFMQRADVFSATYGYRPRVTLYKYLNNISERWITGEYLANVALKRGLRKLVERACKRFKLSKNADLPFSFDSMYLPNESNSLFRISDEVFKYIDSNSEAQKIVAKLGLKFYSSIIDGLLDLKRYGSKVAIDDEYVKSYLSSAMDGWIGKIIEISKRAYKIPDLYHLINLDDKTLMKFKTRIGGWMV